MRVGERSRAASGARSGRVLVLLFLSGLFALAFASLASAATLSGTITDHSTGAPIAGVRLLVNVGEGGSNGEVGSPVGWPETDAAGHWELQVQPGPYWISVDNAPGYYPLGPGAPIGWTGTEQFVVGDEGLNIASQMVPNNTAFIGLHPTMMRWTNIPKYGFRSMALEMSYDSLVLTPSSWPQSTVVTEIEDAAGHSVWPKVLTKEEASRPGEASGAGLEFEAGSADGCQFFSSVPYKQRPKIEGLKVVSFLKSNPSLRVEEVIQPDYTGCSETELDLSYPQFFPGRHVRMYLGATLVDRWPIEQAIPGVMRYVVNGHKPIYVRVKNATEPKATDKASDEVHRGKNKVVATFRPSVDTVTAPAPAHLSFKLPRSYLRPRHHQRH